MCMGYIYHFISCWAPASPPIPKCRLPRRLRLARAAGAGAGADAGGGAAGTAGSDPRWGCRRRARAGRR